MYDAWAASTNRSKSNSLETGIDDSLPRELTFADVQRLDNLDKTPDTIPKL
jgi:hypothetical protein